MREEIFKIFKKVIYIALAIIVITNVKSTEGFAYRDEGPKGLDVYSDENIQIIEFDGVNIDSNPIRIQQNKGYNNIVIAYEDQLIQLNDNFIFDNDGTFNQSVSIVYSEYDDAFYLIRTFAYYNGWDLLSIASLFTIVFSLLSIILIIMDTSFQKQTNPTYFKMNLARKVNRAIAHVVPLSISLIVFYAIFGDLFVNINIFMYRLSDTQFLILWLFFYLILTLLVFLYEVKKNNMSVEFDSKFMTVYKGGKSVFKNPIKEIRTNEYIKRNRNVLSYKDYNQLILFLNNADNDRESFKLDLTAFGINSYNRIANRLTTKHNANLTKENNVLYSDINHNFSIKGRKSKHKLIALTSFVLLCLLYFAIIIAMTLTSAIRPVNVLILSIFPLIILIIVLITSFVKLRKRIDITVSRTGITIDNIRYSTIDIKEIRVTRAHEIGSNLKRLEIVTEHEKLVWELISTPFHHNSIHKKQEYSGFSDSLVTTLPHLVKFI